MRKKLKGTVVSNKTAKTLVVSVERRFKHPVYQKFVSKTKNYHVHCEDQTKFEVGHVVDIVESRPMSKLKRWKVYN